jgi:hypothetical protein
MGTKGMLCWFWRDVASVAVVGAAGMVLVDLAWLALHLGHPPRPFLLTGGVALCTWLHPRVARLVPARA